MTNPILNPVRPDRMWLCQVMFPTKRRTGTIPPGKWRNGAALERSRRAFRPASSVVG